MEKVTEKTMQDIFFTVLQNVGYVEMLFVQTGQRKAGYAAENVRKRKKADNDREVVSAFF